jgi:3-methylfumaryl-CoA hydratase
LRSICGHSAISRNGEITDKKGQVMDFSSWIGNSVTRHDTITPRIIDHFKQSLAPHCFTDQLVPPGLFWCLAPDVMAADQLGADGHPKLGGFLPEIPYERRMWAGGWLEFHGHFAIGDVVRKTSRIDDITFKSGRSGNLCFIAVIHEFHAADKLVLRERHDVVYREIVTPTLPQAAPVATAAPEHRWLVRADPVMLFRYSALTFNGHRIHYDLPYSNEVEGHAGLLVHGPLQATLMLNLACQINAKQPQKMVYRGVRPLTCSDLIMVDADRTEAGRLGCCVRASNGTVTMTAEITL